MEQDATRWIRALRASHDLVATTVAGLDDAALGTQSMASAWTLAQVLSHLGSGAELGVAMLEAARHGGEPPDRDAMAVVWDRWNAMSAREVAVAFVDADDRHIAAFEALSGAELDDLRVPLPFLPEPLDAAGIVGFRLGEHALHAWDVRGALDAGATIAPESTELLIDRLPVMVALLGGFTPRETRPPETVTIAVTTSEPARQFELELGEAAALRPARADAASDGALAIPAEALLRLTSGRLAPGHPSADVRPTGALSLDDLRRAFPGY